MSIARKLAPRAATILAAIVLAGGCAGRVVPATPGTPALGVEPGGRYLTVNGEPFFWLGDTAWLLAQVPTREEVDHYLEVRAAQGFTVIQLTAVAHIGGVWRIERPNAYGDTPFVDNDPARPAVTQGNDPADAAQYDYWDHLDWVLDRVRAHGLRVALVVFFVGFQGEGYAHLDGDNAEAYGRFLGLRYGGAGDVIWILGGDNTPFPADQEIWSKLARSLTVGVAGREDYGRTLMTYHVRAHLSSRRFWSRAPWIDFDMAQSWDRYDEIYPLLLADRAATPARPYGLGEGAYEDGKQYPTGPIDAVVIRRQAAWSYFAGGYHTYGNGNTWHFGSVAKELTQPVDQALFSPGAATLHNMKDFLVSVGWWSYVPDQGLFASGDGGAAPTNVAMLGKDGRSLIAYFASPRAAGLTISRLAAFPDLVARWVSPADGTSVTEDPGDDGVRVFMPPEGWQDALLWVGPTSGD